MGGTSIVFSSVALGIILNISRQINDDEEAKTEPVVEPVPANDENPLTSISDGK
jgi:hypothetical protein